jgi:hypothetical protein
LPIEAGDGAAAASVVIALHPLPVILDVSKMTPAGQHEFVMGFVERIYTLNEKAVHLFVDEADEFAPQYPDPASKHHRRSLSNLDRLVRRGRVKGIGVTLITQRPAVIHKNVLSQVEGLFLMNMFAPHDIEAVSTWMERGSARRSRASCLNELPDLASGMAYLVQSGGDHKVRRFSVRPKRTMDSSRTKTVDDDTSTMNISLAKVPGDILEAARKLLNTAKPSVSISPAPPSDEVV